MSSQDNTVLTRKDLVCNECGYQLVIENNSTYIVCEACDTKYECNLQISIMSQFIFETPSKKHVYKIKRDTLIGRDDLGKITLCYAVDNSIKAILPIRTRYVSHQHAKIKVKKISILKEDNNEKYIISKLICYLEDISKKNGIKVNNSWLVKNKPIELKHNDIIVLAPERRGRVKILFKEV